MTFDGNTADPQSVRWLCEDVEGDGHLVNGEAKIVIETMDGPWTITAVRKGATLDLEEAPPSEYDGSPSYYGFNVSGLTNSGETGI